MLSNQRKARRDRALLSTTKKGSNAFWDHESKYKVKMIKQAVSLVRKIRDQNTA